ncbi:hypothetical protein [Allorhizocola rhizosphaerae]|uniref:hypothetical protein n=1 Tax=Allorhizocola rhizosphaerae TaxID=1872709 RepID=UPI0013C33646|nr:hypothetical protein [Allorhizocola rhizosphaerae]
MHSPRPVDDALRWQLDRVGSAAWEGWCLKFQLMAYGFVEEPGVAGAGEALDWLTARSAVRHDEPPPRGKLVWYADGDTVTVMSSVDGGRVVGTGVNDSVGIIGYRDRPGYVGWTEPIFPYAG